MKKRRLGIVPGLVLASVLILSLATGGVLVFYNRAAADIAQQPAATPGASIDPNPTVVADGTVVPVQYVAASMASGGLVAEVLVHEGDRVEAGQPILRLRSEQQQAALAEAVAAVASAEAQLADLKAGPRDEQIAAVQANVDAARAGLARLEEGARDADIAAARSAVEAAEATLKRLYAGPDENTRIAAEAELSNAEAVLQAAQAAYDLVAGQPDVAMMPQSVQLEQATNAYQAAKARYDALFAEPDVDRVAQARAQVKQAQATLARMLEPATAAELAEAQAQVQQAQAQLDLLLVGARDYQVAAAAAAVDQAQAARMQAEAALADTELRAPISGTVAALHVKLGEQVLPGVPIADLGDLSAWQVETTDLTELDIARVQIGQAVRVTFDALPGVELSGVVTRIQPIGHEKLGDMTYTVTVQLNQDSAEREPSLLWNMTAVVTIP